MSTIFWFDTETTGLYGWKHDIIQFAYLVEKAGEVVEEGCITMQPMNFGEAIDEGALKIHGITREQLLNFQPAAAGHREMLNVISRHAQFAKLTPAGWNAKFDMEFLQANFKKHKTANFGKLFDYHYLDPMVVFNYLRFFGGIKTENAKLATAAEYFGIPLKAHDAMEDIKATRAIAHRLNNFISPAYATT